MAEFASYGPGQPVIDVVSVVPISEREHALTRYSVGKPLENYSHIEADYMVEDELRRINPASYDTIILLQ